MKRLLVLLALSLPCYGQILAPILSASNASTVRTWTLVQKVKSGTNVCAGSANCSLTVASTGSGHLLILMVSEVSPGANIKQTGMTGGGTWVHNGGDAAGLCTDANKAIDCAYVLSSSSGSTTISWTMTGATFKTVADFREYAPSSGSATLDTMAATTYSGFSTTPTGQALTLSGTSDVIVQGITSIDNTCSAIAVYANLDSVNDPNPGTGGWADLLNTSSGTAPTWTCLNTRSAVNAIAFK